jgi:hypothetical protein
MLVFSNCFCAIKVIAKVLYINLLIVCICLSFTCLISLDADKRMKMSYR